MTKSEAILTDSQTEDAEVSDTREPTAPPVEAEAQLDPSQLEAVRRLGDRSGIGAIAWL
jgi:hypothetical protein